MDGSLADRLIDVVDREAGIYSDILKISENKTNIIVEGKVSELENLISLEQSMIVRMGKLEDEREALVEKLARQLQVEPADITVSSLREKLGTDHAERLDGSRSKLLGVMEKVKEVNGLNNKLIKNSLDYIEFSINLLANTAVAGNIYGNSGQTSDTSKRNLFDMKL
ncbi:MAG: flagellar protein FlgN [Clostridiales bacterium]|nr:flagellar protein FlgN [Clostridiales bacterium]